MWCCLLTAVRWLLQSDFVDAYVASLSEVHRRLAGKRSELGTVVARVESALVPPWSLLRSPCDSILCVAHSTPYMP